MRTPEEHEWLNSFSGSIASTDKLVGFLESLGYLDSCNSPYSSIMTDLFPVAYYAICGFFDESEVIQRLAAELNLPWQSIDSSEKDRLIAQLDLEPIRRISAFDLRKSRILPLSLKDGRLSLAMANPLDYESIKVVEFGLGVKVEPVVVAEEDIVAVLDIKLSISDKDAIDFIVKDLKQPLKLINTSGSAGKFETSSVSDDTSAAPVIRLVNKIFSQSIHCGASDLHIIPQKDHLAVKVRVDGIMQPLFEIPNELREAVVSRIKLLCGMDLAEKRLPQDGRLRFKTVHGVRDTRISTVPASYGENIVARILSSNLAGVSFESLHMSEQTVENYKQALKQSSRVHLVTGPTGSGKTTTLYTSLLGMVDGQRNIITLEDPIEYRMEGVTQIQINPKLQLNFAQGLRSILRQDPDVVLVGEIRDEETASISMKVAQTGHIVLSTLHTNSAESAITRLRDLHVPSYLIASSLGSVMAQRLVRGLCQDCCRPAKDEEKASLADCGIDLSAVQVPVGCDKCRNTGYQGRLGIYSFLEITDDIRDAIRNDCGEDEIIRRAQKNRFCTLLEAARECINSGQTSVSEVERVLGPLMAENHTKQLSRAESSTLVAAGKQEGLGRPRVLLVEDDADTREVYSMILKKELFEVENACHGQEALEKIYERLPDLIISDVMMPKMSGIELLQRLRNDKRLRDIPVLMLTANDSEQLELDLMSGGANDFVRKTSRPEILSARARRLLDQETILSL